MAELLRTGRPIRNREILVERPDGVRITILTSLDPLLNQQGETVGGVNCFQDITERKQTEDMLREREQRSADLLEALPAAIYTTDAAGRVTFYNQAAVELWVHRPALHSDRWCGSWRLYRPDGTPMPLDQCSMAVALRENRPIRDAEAIAERPDQKPLIGELNHRVKNTLATVQTIARQTLRQAKSPADFVPTFSGRLQALVRTHTLLTQSVCQGADLMALIREQLLLDAGDGRIACAGPGVIMEPEMALHIAMVLHDTKSD